MERYHLLQQRVENPSCALSWQQYDHRYPLFFSEMNFITNGVI